MITKWKDKGFTSGQTADVTLANGKTRKCTATGYSHLRTEEYTEVSILMIEKKDRAFSHGQTEGNTKVGGSMVNSMVKLLIQRKMAQ